LFKANACGDGITIVGWPVDHGRTGMAAWALQLPGSGLMGTRNAARRYSGRDHSPAADAAEPWPERAGYGRDGQRWSAISGS
ncbi:MAG: hypothetical protein QF615_03910, partial [Planctomycetota bacterium]|nr:hypothetical protein [Planctomycetota bacterium]